MLPHPARFIFPVHNGETAFRAAKEIFLLGYIVQAPLTSPKAPKFGSSYLAFADSLLVANQSLGAMVQLDKRWKNISFTANVVHQAHERKVFIPHNNNDWETWWMWIWRTVGSFKLLMLR